MAWRERFDAWILERKEKKGLSHDIQYRDQNPPTSSYSLRVSQERKKIFNHQDAISARELALR